MTRLSLVTSDYELPYLPSGDAASSAIITESGLPDPETFPADELGRLFDQVLHDDAATLQYGTFVDGELFYGPRELRALLAERSRAEHGRQIDERSVMITSGAAHGIALAAQALVDPGDLVAVESPSWDFILRDLTVIGADVLTVASDAAGLVVDEFAEQLAELRDAGRSLSLLYTIPTFNVPTGSTMPLERRERLLELADEFGFVILEDDVYGSLRYDGEPVPSLFSLDRSGVVVRVDSFSKTIMPGLRAGWAMGDPEVIAAMARLRRDLGPSQLISRVLHRYVADGLYDPHVEYVRGVYRQKRDAAVSAIEEYCGPLVRCDPPDGGYFLWLQLAPEVDGERLHSLAAEQGVICRPGARFFDDPEAGASFLRLSFTEASIDDLRRAAQILGEAAATSVVSESRA